MAGFFVCGRRVTPAVTDNAPPVLASAGAVVGCKARGVKEKAPCISAESQFATDGGRKPPWDWYSGH